MLVRADLPMAQQIIQAVHASYEAGSSNGTHSKPPSVVVCSTTDESSLLFEAAKLMSRGVRLSIFREPDRNNEATAFATECVNNNRRKLFSKWKLWKGE